MHGFEWDENKRQSNLKTHRIDFSMIKYNFYSDGEAIETTDERREYGEERIQKIMKINDIIFFIVYTKRQGKIRLISARIADEKEREEYGNRSN